MEEKYKELHLEELPFGEMPKEETETTIQELIKMMAFQIQELAMIILWIRCMQDGSLKDIEGRNIRKMSVDYLLGGITYIKIYQDFVREYCQGKDPLDLTEYLKKLIIVYNQRQLLKQASE